MATIVVAANILVQFLLGDWLTWGALSYPLAFLVTDVMNRVYGPTLARRVVFVGFLVGVACSLVASVFDLTTLRIAVGSGLAFLTDQLLAVFNRIRSGKWWAAPMASSFVGSSIDTLLFFSIAFSQFFSFIDPSDDVSWANELLPLLSLGPMSPLWVSLAVADWGVKLGLALLALLPFRLIVKRLMAAQPQH